MEPTKNTNNINASSNESLEPVFRGMPKPGQPLASTPRVNATAPANLPTSSAQVSPTLSPASSVSSPFSAHSPSALDRLMNPNLAQNTVVPPAPAPTMSSAAPITPASTFKPYTPPTKPTSSPVAPISQTSGYKVGAPTQYPSTQYPPTQTSSTSPSAMQSTGSSSPSYSNGIPPAPSANVTAAKLGNEVKAILNNQPAAPKNHKGTLALIIGMIIVLLLLLGGGYYWYTYMYLSNTENANETTQNSANDPYNQVNTNNTNSAFPAVVTKPAVTAQPVSTPAKTTPVKTPSKVNRVTAPFNQSQRDIVSSYIYTNINKLATPKSTTPYEVTDITFDGPDRAVVQYTNGRSSYAAIAVASIDSSDNVRIVSFSLLEK